MKTSIISRLVLALLMTASSLYSQPDITIEPTRPTDRCSNGALNLILDGGIGPYSVDWYWEADFGTFLIEENDDLPGNNGVEDLEDLPAGNYRVNITDAACGQASIVIELQQGLFSSGADRIIIEKRNVSSCDRESTNDGKISIVDVIGVSSGYGISWSGQGVNGNTSSSIDNLSPGDYTVEITTREGCRLEKTITICCCGSGPKSDEGKDKCGNQELVFPISIYQGSLLSPDDENSYNGEISINVQGGTSDNVIVWTGPNGFSSTRTHIRNLGVGEYCVSVSDGCSKASKCFELISCASRSMVISGDSENTCQGLSFGAITASVQGGDPPYRYTWSNGANSSAISNLSSGTYRLTVSDRNGCYSSTSYFIDDNIQIRETRNGCVFIYDCNGNEVRDRRNDIGSYREVRPSDCRFEDTRCSDGVLVQERFVGTRFDSYSSANCTVREFCVLTGQTYENHNGVSRSDALEGFDGSNSCWWCHDVEYCQFPSLDGAVQINNVISNISISFVPGNNCVDAEHELHRVFCRNVLIWEGCSKDETVCSSSLLGVKMKEEINEVKLPDGRLEVRKTYKVVEFDRSLILDNLKERGLVNKDAKLLNIENPNEKTVPLTPVSNAKISDVQESDLKLHPNPFYDKLIFTVSGVKMKNLTSLSIYDSYGSRVYVEKYGTSSQSIITKTLDLVDLPSGIYFLKFSLGNGFITKKIVKI